MNENANFAIFRTRFQPYTAAHDWAIRNFMYWAHAAPSLTFGITSLVLAAVDPLLEPKEKNIREHARFAPALNPFTEWGILHVLHSRRCDLATHRNNQTKEPPAKEHERYCRKVIIARIPALTPLSYEKGAGKSRLADKKHLIVELKRRLPIDPSNVWYFPCFDQEDLNDILALWNAMKEGQETKKDNGLKIPEMRLVVSYHPGFAYQRKNSLQQKIVMGPYGEATLQIAEIQSEEANGGTALFPDHIQALLTAARPSNWNEAIAQCREAVFANQLLDEDDLYHVSREKMLDDLIGHCTNLFGQDFCSKKIHFLPPEQSPTVLRWRTYLLREVFDPLRRALSNHFNSIVGDLKKKVDCRLPLTEAESLGVLRQTVKSVRQSGIALDQDTTNKLSDWETRRQPPPATDAEADA